MAGCVGLHTPTSAEMVVQPLREGVKPTPEQVREDCPVQKAPMWSICHQVAVSSGKCAILGA